MEEPYNIFQYLPNNQCVMLQNHVWMKEILSKNNVGLFLIFMYTGQKFRDVSSDATWLATFKKTTSVEMWVRIIFKETIFAII